MTGKSQAKAKIETLKWYLRNLWKKGPRDDYFLFTPSYICSYAHNGRLKQMEADNKKGA